MVEPCQEGLCAFVCKELDGVLHLAVQAKLECGNQDIIELAPTVQTLTGNYKNTDFKLPFSFQFFASMYSAFSLRIHISDLDLNPGNKKLVPQTLKKMIGLSKMTLWMVAIATFLGIWLARY